MILTCSVVAAANWRQQRRLRLLNNVVAIRRNKSHISDLFLFHRAILAFTIVLLFAFIPCSSCTSLGFESNEKNPPVLLSKPKRIYTNQFAVHLMTKSGADDAQLNQLADRLASQYGFVNNGKVLDLTDSHDDSRRRSAVYLFVLPRVKRRSTRQATKRRYFDSLRKCRREKSIIAIEQQVAKRRVKRDFVHFDRRKNAGAGRRNNNGDQQCLLEPCGGGGDRPSFVVDPNDPEWKNMWYLSDKFSHNVKEAWNLGVTGKDVVVTILDDGLEISHPDIRQNYDPRASYDINENDSDPTPRYLVSVDNKHGTRCAGEVAAVFNNSMCIVGVAHGAKIGGIKMLDGDVTDVIEAASLSHNRQHVDIYSASWGPEDDGKSLDGPATLASLAFKQGVESGRGGLGSIFVWASGNGGGNMDSCNCDGYTNSIYTLSISSTTERGLVPWYSEACSSTLAATYSSGGPDERQIVTTDVHHNCTSAHTGTSASAPLAAGICALTLEANPRLTWRDMQHIVVRTARRLSLYASDWRTNAMGRQVSHSFGYGLMDAAAMVKLATVWTGSDGQKNCVLVSRQPIQVKEMSLEQQAIQVSESDHCSAGELTNVRFLEHVQARVTLNVTGRRGDLQISLTSPRGTRSTLLSKRANDYERRGFTNWPFMTVHMWGESPFGSWTLEVQNDGRDVATLIRWDLVLYGTSEQVGPTGVLKSKAINFSVGEQQHHCCSFSPLSLCTGAMLTLITVFY